MIVLDTIGMETSFMEWEWCDIDISWKNVIFSIEVLLHFQRNRR